MPEQHAKESFTGLDNSIETNAVISLLEHVETGKAYDLKERCEKSGIPLTDLVKIVLRNGLDSLDRLPGYAVTEPLYLEAKERYSKGESRQRWQQVKIRHDHRYLESKTPRYCLKQLDADPERSRRYYVQLFFSSWAAFWDEEFLLRMIEKADSRIVSYIPDFLLTKKTCFAAVNKWGAALRYLPIHQRTLAICLAAVEADHKALAFVPSAYREKVRKSIR